MKSDKILLLGNPKLNEVSAVIEKHELPYIETVVQDLNDILFEFKARYGAFRGIAAPQIGVMKRLIYIHIHEPMIIINPVLDNLSEETFEMWDDCMCFPNLLVKLKRHKHVTLHYRNEHWQEKTINFSDDLAELIQHEYDHLNGILATERAIDKTNSFRWRNEIPYKAQSMRF